MGMMVAPHRYGPPPAPDFIPAVGDFSTTVGSPTTADGTDSLFMSAPFGTTQKRALLKSLPGGDFTVILGVRGHLTSSGASHGIMFRDSSGAYICVGNLNDGGVPKSTIAQITSANAFSLITGRAHGSSTKPIWFKANFTASSNDVDGFWSYVYNDNWTSMGTSTFLGTADAFGLGFIQAPLSSDPDPQNAWFFHFEVI